MEFRFHDEMLWLGDFEGWLEAGGRSQRTVQAYLMDVGRFACWYETETGEGLRPEQVTSWDLRAFREWSLGSERCAPATWNRRRAALRVWAQWIREAGFSVLDVFQGVEAMEEEGLAPRWLGSGDLRRLLRAVEQGVAGASTEAWRAQALRDQAMVFLMVFAGLREGEVVALNVEDVVLGERSGRVIVRRGKGDKRREAPLNVEVRRVLSVWLDLRRGAGSEPLFIGKGSERLTTRTVQRRVAELGGRAGVSLTPHQLRHTFAKRVLDGGASLTVVQKLMGHARLETTARYVQPGWGDLERAVSV